MIFPSYLNEIDKLLGPTGTLLFYERLSRIRLYRIMEIGVFDF